MTQIMEADGIQLEFDGRKILSAIYLKCEKGKVTGLLGRNGQGKSCLMNCIFGSLSCEKSVRFDRILIKKPYKRPDLIRYLPQFHFIPKSIPLRHIFKDFDLDYHLFTSRFPEFTKRENVSIGTLSEGERRLVEIYVIVRCASQFAMLDEPFTALNPLQIEKVTSLLLEEKKNKGLLVTDHLYRHVLDVSDQLYVLANGRTTLINHISEIELLGYVRL